MKQAGIHSKYFRTQVANMALRKIVLFWTMPQGVKLVEIRERLGQVFVDDEWTYYMGSTMELFSEYFEAPINDALGSWFFPNTITVWLNNESRELTYAYVASLEEKLLSKGFLLYGCQVRGSVFLTRKFMHKLWALGSQEDFDRCLQLAQISPILFLLQQAHGALRGFPLPVFLLEANFAALNAASVHVSG